MGKGKAGDDAPHSRRGKREAVRGRRQGASGTGEELIIFIYSRACWFSFFLRVCGRFFLNVAALAFPHAALFHPRPAPRAPLDRLFSGRKQRGEGGGDDA